MLETALTDATSQLSQPADAKMAERGKTCTPSFVFLLLNLNLFFPPKTHWHIFTTGAVNYL